MKQFIINEDLAQAVANYLSTRPFREVAALMNGLGTLTMHEKKPDEAAGDQTGTGALASPT